MYRFSCRLFLYVEVSSFEFRDSQFSALTATQDHQGRERNYVVASVAVAASGTLTADGEERRSLYTSFRVQCD